MIYIWTTPKFTEASPLRLRTLSIELPITLATQSVAQDPQQGITYLKMQNLSSTSDLLPEPAGLYPGRFICMLKPLMGCF